MEGKIIVMLPLVPSVARPASVDPRTGTVKAPLMTESAEEIQLPVRNPQDYEDGPLGAAIAVLRDLREVRGGRSVEHGWPAIARYYGLDPKELPDAEALAAR